ncbi:MAG: alpha/beta fold hydrolase [Acidimicrobiia bacterium]
MPTTTAPDGSTIAYEVEGSGPPLVLVHGLSADRRELDPIVERLAPEFTCVRLDLRGHGKSEAARTAHDVFSMAGDVAAVVGATGVGAPLIIGHSMGGMVATIYAASGEPVRGVVNVEQPLRMVDFAAIVRPFEDALRGPEFHEIFGSFIAALGVDVLPPEVAARVRANSQTIRPEVVLDVWGPLFTATDDELTALVEADMLAKIRVPYLVLHGSEPGDDYRAWLTGVMPTATIEVWEGDQHWLHLVEPDRFSDRIRDLNATI